jgi:hypothetical protein
MSRFSRNFVVNFSSWPWQLSDLFWNTIRIRQSSWVPLPQHGRLICFETGPGFSPNYTIILEGFLIWFWTYVGPQQSLNFWTSCFTAFSCPKSVFVKIVVFAKIFAKVFAKTFVIFITFRNIFFEKNTKTKVFVSTLLKRSKYGSYLYIHYRYISYVRRVNIINRVQWFVTNFIKGLYFI